MNKNIVLLVLAALTALLILTTAISYNDAQNLRKVCTATVTSTEVMHSSNKYFREAYAKFTVNGIPYIASGMASRDTFGSQVVVKYNPDNPNQCYCGSSPVWIGPIFVFLSIVMCIITLGYLVYWGYDFYQRH